ncbi:MAG TPA: ATP-binding protein [Patescibacteria group bacterium]|nr:ATP-binding protein [Patescibacteria group bacterium]
MISRRLARLIRRHFGTEDAEGFIAQLASPENARKLAQNFPAFAAAVDDGYHELDERMKIAVRNLDISSQELNASNFALLRHNIATNAMMEGLGQGLLFFDAKGICSPVYSRACVSLLESIPAERHIADVLRLDDQQRADFLPLIGMMFDPDSTALGFDELIALAPHFYRHSQGLQIALSYKPMYGATGVLMGILMVATDITQKIEAQERLKAKEDQVLRTLRIAGNRASFVHALRVFKTVTDGIAQTHDVTALRRDLHTIKGMARVFYLNDLAQLLHELEDRIDALAEVWQGGLAQLAKEYEVRLALGIDYAHWLGREIWGMEFETADDVISVSTSDLAGFGRELYALLQSGNASPDAARRMFFERIASQSVWSLLAFFETQLSYFAEAADRGVRIQHAPGDEVRLFPDFYRGFFDSLTHVARNLMDHAFEEATVRAALKKPAELNVKIRTAYDSPARDWFTITISDDGQGVPTEKLRARLEAQGKQVDGRSDAELLQHVFDHDISTRTHVDLNAGRGVGMSAVKAATQKLGGEITMASEEGRGATLHFRLPVLWELKEHE